MKLFVIEQSSNEKKYLRQNANTRKGLSELLGSNKFKIDDQIFTVDDVQAEPNENTAGAMALGGVIGVAGGVPGVIIGGLIGALLGKGTDNDDKVRVDKFNRSTL
ncbi:MAG: hypothetical protein HRT97_12725 [Moritella sp.]|uniref:hypothetical protein n=1 Tax=Moritella sp. TaxID=78556 RepID=UPI0025D2D2AB|nr:hypothetical protein [Moritella sp.]NQZ93188.1 hypothetical protein [Moritella sp.]